jgi:hypothetical protein
VLLDSTGKPAGDSTADSASARQFFRSLYVGRPVTAGTWKLRLTNKTTFDQEVVLTAWQGAGK